MQILKDTWNKKGDIHHAYVVGGMTKDDCLELSGFLRDLFPGENPDIRILHYDVFGIGEARTLRNDQMLSSIGTKQVFIINPKSVTVEAQNALLKVFEEPAHDTHFFLCVDERVLLPTLRSRMVSIRRTREDRADGELAEVFLKKSFGEQILFVRNIAEKKDKEEAGNLLNSLEEILHGDVFKNRKALKVVQSTKRHLGLRGANIKLLLENLVLSL